MSWNGATEVVAWKVGESTYPKTGFETTVPAPARTTVHALDASGAVLATSSPR